MVPYCAGWQKALRTERRKSWRVASFLGLAWVASPFPNAFDGPEDAAQLAGVFTLSVVVASWVNYAENFSLLQQLIRTRIKLFYKYIIIYCFYYI